MCIKVCRRCGVCMFLREVIGERHCLPDTRRKENLQSGSQAASRIQGHADPKVLSELRNSKDSVLPLLFVIGL